jgi:UDP-N-acetylglucosamine diphosphorylase/glucosamine-1-phosphate N-acetyltransferase
MDYLTVVILAGGQGARMQSTQPKVLLLLKDRPMLVRVIETAQLLNPHKIIVITGQQDSLIKTTISKYMPIGSITFVNQPVPLGTGDAVKCCLSEIKDDGPVLILNGDMPLITEQILQNIISIEADAIVLTANFENPTGYGRIICNSRGVIQKIVEEKDCSDEERAITLINTGVYCIHSILLKEFIYKIENDNAQKEYYLTDIIKLLKGRSMHIKTLLLDQSENIYVSGANTPEELAILESYYAS